MGTVIKIALSEKTQKPNIVYIKFDDSEAGRKAITKHSNSFARHNNVVPIEPVLAKIKIRPGKPLSPEIQRTQFPSTLGYACSVHKVHGLTLKKVVVSFDLLKQRSFNYGQIYVALSHSTSLQGLRILGNIEMKDMEARSGQNSDIKIVPQDSFSATVIPFNGLLCISIGNSKRLFSVCS